MLPASLAACVPVFIATATSAWASAGASLVPSPVMATSRPPAWYSRISFSLASGVACGEEVVDAGLGGDGGGGQRVVAGDHHRLDAHAAQLGEALLDAALDDVLQVDDAEHAARRRRRRAACRPASAIASTIVRTSAGNVAAHAARRRPRSRRRRPCGSGGRSRSTPLMRVCAVKGTNVGAERVDVALAQAVLLLGQHDDAAALRRLVGQRGELRGVGQLLARSRPAAGMNAVAWRLPSVIVPVLSSSSTSTSPAASTARPDMAITFAWIMRSMPAMPMAESSPPIVVGIRQTSSATSTVTVTGAALAGRARRCRARRAAA